MSFIDTWVWWLGGPLIGVMVVWHVLRTRATRHPVPSLQLWQFITAEQRSRRPVTWPNPWWLFVLRLIICGLLVFAAAGPVWSAAATMPTRVLVIDTSASMRARTPQGVRIDIAKQQAQALIDTAPVATRFTIVEINATMQIRGNQLRDRADAQRIVAALTAVPVAGDMRALLPQLRALDNQRSELFVISDDAALWQTTDWPAGWQRVPIGGDAPNYYIQGVTMQYTATGWQGVVSVAIDGNAAPTPRLLEVRDVSGTLYDATYVNPRLGVPATWSFSMPVVPDVLVVALQPDAADALADDDVYWWRKPTQTPLRVYLQSLDTRFLPAALQVLPNVIRVAKIDDADIAIIDSPATIPTDTVLPTWLINPPQQTQASFPVLVPTTLLGDAALLAQDVDLQSTQIVTASLLTTPIWGQRWLQSSLGTHAYVGVDDGVAHVVFGFALTHTDLPLRVEFPLLVRNVLRYLAPAAVSDSMQTGRPFAVQTARTLTTPPQLMAQPIPMTARLTQINQKWYLVDITNIGAYQIDTDWYVANLLAPWESATQRDATTSSWQTFGLQVGLSLRAWCLWLSLVLLLCERALTWWTRRVT